MLPSHKQLLAVDQKIIPYLFAVYVDDVGKLFNVYFGTYIVLYADDILLLAPSVTVLQRLLQACEEELDRHDKNPAVCLLARDMIKCVLR